MKEHTDYVLTPTDIDNEQAWDIRIQTGEFVETVIRYGNVAIDGVNERLTFNFAIVSSPDPDLTTENEQLQEAAGQILLDLIESNMENGSLLMDERD